MDRQTIDQTMLTIATALGARAACLRRQVGCVLADARGRIIGSGYNGRPAGDVNCSPLAPCSNEQCDGVHAEINALLQAKGDDVAACYCSVPPCWHCVKALVNTGCWRIVFPRRQQLEQDFKARSYWEQRGRQWIML